MRDLPLLRAEQPRQIKAGEGPQNDLSEKWALGRRMVDMTLKDQKKV